MGTPTSSPSIIACCATCGRGIRVSRLTPPAMRSSSPSRVHPTRWPPPPMREERACVRPCSGALGLHTGEPLQELDKYVGIDVHRAARIAAAGHGGQVLLSQTTAGPRRRRHARSRRTPAQGSERSGAGLPARHGRLPAPEDAARDEPPHSGDAVCRARAGARRDCCAV